MVGLWEGVPASPCSGASDEAPSRPVPTRFSQRTRAKRTRAAARVEASSVGFVDPKTSDNSSDKDTALVEKLNTSAADERRKILLAKLRLIDQRKAALKATSSGLSSAATSRDAMASLFEAATPEPDDDDAALTSSTIKGDTVLRRPSTLTLDVSVARACSLPSADMEKFCSGLKPSASAVFGSPLPSPGTQTRKSPSLSYADLPTRRSSRRTTRPRTPNVLLNGMPGETVLRKLPVGVLKCKRFCFAKKVISILFKNPSAAPFSAPVKDLWKPEAIPRYFDVISRPMDLGTIKKNMEGTHYLNTEESNALFMFRPESFANDVRQVFRNAKIYNRSGDALYNCANDLLNDFEQMWSKLPELPSRDGSRKRQGSAIRSLSAVKRGRLSEQPLSSRSRLNGVAPKSPVKGKASTQQGAGSVVLDDDMTPRQLRKRLDYLKKCQIALKSRMALPKGASFYDRAALIRHIPVTDAQKNEIFKGIKRLPPAKQSTFLEIVGKSEDDDEVEIDIQAYDNETLRNIEAYLDSTLPNFKTIRNSAIGREFEGLEEFEDEMKMIEAKLEAAKQPKTVRKIAPPVEPVVCVSVKPELANQLYASSDEESGSDSDSDSSDSETE